MSIKPKGTDWGEGGALRLKELTSDQTARVLAHDSRIIIPSGTIARYHPSLPLGSSTIIAEYLADELSAEFKVIRAAAFEYGVNATSLSSYLGRVSVRKKTLRQFLNDTLASWEDHGVDEFIILTAHAYDPHLEAVESVATKTAKIRAVNLLSVDLSDIVPESSRSEFETIFISLMLFIAPQLVRDLGEDDIATPELGEALYDRIRTKIRERIFLAPPPTD